MAEITDFGPRKTFFILAIVFGCFTVLWPKILHPMFIGFVTPHHSASDSSVCCEVIFESDVTAVDIMQEMCQNILRHHPIDPRVRDALKLSKLTPQTASLCREEVLARCGIDLSSFLAERESLGKTYKQVLEEIRSFNSSLCLKMNFGVPLSQLGTPHLIRYHILMPHNTIPQERRTPPHAGGMHPALRERGRAIPTSHIVPKIVMDRSADQVIPKMRPPLGGAGHVVPAPKGNGTMGIIMPLYTIGIVLFFVYTIVKVLKKNTDSEIISDYPGADAEKEFRKMVFSPEALATAMTGGTLHYRERSPHRAAPTIEELNDQAAGDIEIDQLRQRLVETEAAMERIVVQMGNISRSVMHNSSPQPEIKEDTADQESHSREGEELDTAEQSPTVKVMGMEMTASCESGQKCSRPTTPIIPTPSNVEREKTPPTPIYLEGALPPQCELLVTDSETQAEKSDDDDAPVVLSGKMTLSVISLDQIPADSEEAETPDVKRKKVFDTKVDIRDVKGEENKILQKEEDREVEKVESEEEEEYEEEIEEEENEEEEEEENERSWKGNKVKGNAEKEKEEEKENEVVEEDDEEVEEDDEQMKEDDEEMEEDDEEVEEDDEEEQEEDEEVEEEDDEEEEEEEDQNSDWKEDEEEEKKAKKSAIVQGMK